jgi:hypothetical protein
MPAVLMYRPADWSLTSNVKRKNEYAPGSIYTSAVEPLTDRRFTSSKLSKGLRAGKVLVMTAYSSNILATL